MFVISKLALRCALVCSLNNLCITPSVVLYLVQLLNILQINTIITWQGKSKHSDWFFLSQDFAIWTISMETVIGCAFFVFESQQIQNKHGLIAIL